MDTAMDVLRSRYTQHPEWFRNNKICFLDTILTRLWVARYNEFLSFSNALPPDSYDYGVGEKPVYCKTRKAWGLEVEDIYCPLHVKGDHWIALWMSLPNRHIEIWDSDVYHVKDKELEVLIQPFIHMLPYLLHTVALAEDKHKYSLEKFTYERKKGLPWNKQSGDCGVYALKYIECHALGMLSFPNVLCDANIKAIRSKLAADIFHEIGLSENEAQDRSMNMLDMYDEMK